MRATRRIAIDWKVPPTESFRGGNVVTPFLRAMLDHDRAFGHYEAVLVPSARYTLLPTGIAQELGVVPQNLERVSDPLFPGFDLWKSIEDLVIRVFGSSSEEYLELKLPVAFDSTSRLSSVVLGERFFFQVRVHFEPDKRDQSWIEQFRFLGLGSV